MRRLGLLVAAVTSAAALAACGNGEGDTTVVPEESGSGSETEDLPIAGTSWKLHNVESVDDLPSEPPADAMFVIEDGEVSGNTGCNSFGGDAEVDAEAGTIAFSQVIATARACTGERGQIDQAMLGAMEGEVKVEVSGDTLTLTPESGHPLVLRATDEEPPEDTPEGNGSPDTENTVDDSEDSTEEPPTISFNEDVPTEDE